MFNGKKPGIQLARERAELSKLDLANKMNVDVSVINAWEAGAGAIRLSELVKLSQLLNVSCDMLLFSEERDMLNIQNLDETQKQYVIELYRQMKNHEQE